MRLPLFSTISIVVCALFVFYTCTYQREAWNMLISVFCVCVPWALSTNLNFGWKYWKRQSEIHEKKAIKHTQTFVKKEKKKEVCSRYRVANFRCKYTYVVSYTARHVHSNHSSDVYAMQEIVFMTSTETFSLQNGLVDKQYISISNEIGRGHF